MKGTLITLAVIFFFLLTIGGCGCSRYNGMVSNRETVKTSFADLQATYQRRSDLIGNLVKTIEGSANFEKSTLTEVIAARASATQMKIDASSLTPETMKAFQAQQGQLGAAMGRLMMVTEKYPDLQTTSQFRDMTTELEGTENRIKVARTDYNAAVKVYNMSIITFPGNVYAGFFHFVEMPYFQADSAAQKAPNVQFNIK